VAFSGCAVLLEAWVELVVCIMAMLFAYFLRITAEEKLLIEIFGEEYATDQAKTWRLAPFVS
jgi:protein-S-isoprenylcysteine O-methyltransferase Ste14